VALLGSHKSILRPHSFFTLADFLGFEGWGEHRRRKDRHNGKRQVQNGRLWTPINSSALGAPGTNSVTGNIDTFSLKSPPYQLAKRRYIIRNTKFRGSNSNRLGFDNDLLLSQEIKKS
jgi:hypothetical protein